MPIMMKYGGKRGWSTGPAARKAYCMIKSTFVTVPVWRIEGVAPFMGRMSARQQSCLLADQRDYLAWKLYGKPTFSLGMGMGLPRRTQSGTGSKVKCWLRKYSHGGRIWQFLVKAARTGLSIEAKVPCLPINWVRHRPLARATRAFVADLVSQLPSPKL